MCSHLTHLSWQEVYHTGWLEQVDGSTRSGHMNERMNEKKKGPLGSILPRGPSHMSCDRDAYALGLLESAKFAVTKQMPMQTKLRMNMRGNPPAESITKDQKTAATALMSEPTMEMRA